MAKYYPESRVEINGLTAKYYDTLLDIASFGKYPHFIKEAIEFMRIKPSDIILDLGSGTGRNACLMAKYLSPEGELIAVDISWDMIRKFKRKCAGFPNLKVINARADKTLPFKVKFDKVFVSFLLHGFPHDVRESIIENVYRLLKKGGNFFVLDYNEFSYSKMPFCFRVLFKTVECPYAFDFIERDWKEILRDNDFGFFREKLFFKNYIRILEARKNN